jgi:hypothetical protein
MKKLFSMLIFMLTVCVITVSASAANSEKNPPGNNYLPQPAATPSFIAPENPVFGYSITNVQLVDIRLCAVNDIRITPFENCYLIKTCSMTKPVTDVRCRSGFLICYNYRQSSISSQLHANNTDPLMTIVPVPINESNSLIRYCLRC